MGSGSWVRRLAVAALLMPLPAAAQATVNYAIDLSKAEHHLGDVSISFPRADGQYLDVKMPAWRTGRYTILDLANGVRGFTATDEQGRALRWEKVDKSTWRIFLPGPSVVRVAYEVYGNELGLRTRHIDDSHAYLDASAVFMYADRFRSDDVTVGLKVPTGWRSYSGMQSPAPQQFVAPNWDVLVDSPIETGTDQAYRFQSGGRDYEVVFWGDGNYDAQQVVSDLQKMVAQAPSIWSGDYPFKRYLFIIHATDGAGGATEHINSTVIQRPRYSFRPRSAYLSFLSTASHEFIHTWNVKAYRAAGLVPYEYQKENYTDLLWLEEGSTEYFADHLLLRAGIMKPDDYFGSLSQVIATHQQRPGRNVQSVAEASFDEWISTGGDYANNASVDIYNEGAIASWMLDLALLQKTGGRVSYRDVHNTLYHRFDSRQRGFTDQDVLAILKELTGTSWDAWWAQNIRSPLSAVDFQALLNPVGLRLSHGTGEKKAYAGWGAKADEGGARLMSVLRGSPAWDSGFVPDDLIIALDGKWVGKDRFEAALGEHRPGDSVTVTYVRRGELQQKTLKLGETFAQPPKVGTIERPTPQQKALFQRWLLVPYPKS